MSIVESEAVADDIPQGVVLMLVGPSADSQKDSESPRTLRMHSLASLVSLALWAISQPVGFIGFIVASTVVFTLFGKNQTQ